MKQVSRRTALLMAMALCSAFCSQTWAQDRGFGLGIILGDPTGLSWKSWQSKTRAVAGAIAWSSEDNKDEFHLHLDFLHHHFIPAKAKKKSENTLPFYYGIGGRVIFKDDNNPKTEDDTTFGVRIPLGLDFMFSNAPMDVFVEVVPALDLVPDTDFDLEAAGGIRYFF